MTRLAIVQLAAQDGRSLDDSLASVEAALDRAGPADLYLLPEIWSPGYFAFDRYAASGDQFEATVEKLASLARRRTSYLHAGSLIEPRHGGLNNTSLLFAPGGEVVASYRKIHLFGYGSREQELLTPGDEVVVAETEFGRVGMAVCYDLRFPEQFRRMADLGARLFLVASAWPHPRVEAWTTLLRARAIENQAYVAAANGVGAATGAVLCGRSAVIDPWGVTVTSGGDAPTELVADIDLEEVAAVRASFPALADRRLRDDEPSSLVLSIGNEAPIRFEVRRVVVAGYTARDPEVVRAYVDGLAAKGIEPPPEIPMYFHVGRELVTTRGDIDVAGAETCGEVEFALLVTDDGEVLVAAGSDHTDRKLEQSSIPASKQACPKPISQHVWRYKDVRARWDQLVLRSFTPANESEPYQMATASALRHPDDLLERVRARFGPDMRGTVIFGGSFASRSGQFAFHESFRSELLDPASGDALVADYWVHDVMGGGTGG